MRNEKDIFHIVNALRNAADLFLRMGEGGGDRFA